MAHEHKLRVQAIDMVQHHVAKAQRDVARCGLGGQVRVQRMDYLHLEGLEDESLDGVYTMATLVHATDPKKVLEGFFRLLRPGGRLVMFEYDNIFTPDTTDPLAGHMRYVNKVAAMPTNDISYPGVFRELLEAGFVNVEVQEYSDNIRPMTRLFYILAFAPYLVITALGLKRFSINTVTGVGSYKGYGSWQCVAISADKPGDAMRGPKSAEVC